MGHPMDWVGMDGAPEMTAFWTIYNLHITEFGLIWLLEALPLKVYVCVCLTSTRLCSSTLLVLNSKFK